jgi:hypothetical protein
MIIWNILCSFGRFFSGLGINLQPCMYVAPEGEHWLPGTDTPSVLLCKGLNVFTKGERSSLGGQSSPLGSKLEF